MHGAATSLEEQLTRNLSTPNAMLEFLRQSIRIKVAYHWFL